MSLAFNLVTGSIKVIFGVICKVDTEPIHRIPTEGPLILVCNHINFLEAPVMYSHLQPRRLTGLAKAETWDDPLLGPLFSLWEAIPVRRGEADLEALRMAWKALEQGKILAIAPEGTRSGDGRLMRGHPGIVPLALHANYPLLPVAYFGHEVFPQNIRHLQRTPFHVRVGRKFTIKPPASRLNSVQRQAITDEIMYQLAMLLPENNRGFYSQVECATTDWLVFAGEQ